MQYIAAFIIGLLFIIAVTLTMAIPTQWLWNTTMPQVFALKALTYWQTVRLMLICQILIKGSSVSTKD